MSTYSGENTGYWYNFITGETEPRTESPTTDEDARKYIPPECLDLYSLYREMGKSVQEAMMDVYSKILGVGA